mmetsp:Transcript_13580/g.21206  ORF Transcript_13580/g.21206 Transcript_13580/m.21206 type:complete len:83 (+) Transcript_13580:730-978(+)
MFFAETLASFLLVTGILHIKNLAVPLRQLSTREIKSILQQKLEQIRSQFQLKNVYTVDGNNGIRSQDYDQKHLTNLLDYSNF